MDDLDFSKRMRAVPMSTDDAEFSKRMRARRQGKDFESWPWPRRIANLVRNSMAGEEMYGPVYDLLHHVRKAGVPIPGGVECPALGLASFSWTSPQGAVAVNVSLDHFFPYEIIFHNEDGSKGYRPVPKAKDAAKVLRDFSRTCDVYKGTK